MKEIEIRSRIDKKKYEELLNLLKEKDKNSKFQKQFAFSSDKPKDVRVKLIDNEYYLVNLKEGQIGDISREEITFTIKKEEFKHFMKFLKSNGFEYFTKWETYRNKFKVDEINIDLDFMPNFGYYIEFEILCNDEVNEEKIINNLKKMMNLFGVKEISKEEFINHVDEYRINNKIHVDELLKNNNCSK